ncbi:hypothetical protein LSH36_368g05172 [Paralvinella palmiformis]|uniref:Uncharacterized protein n=1 Tax=Paralvinella palmiformis TaxID=53620 RepID=A0AAD9JE85_9ANNE|nr:hypothetical protein LSH36_368g05172 [Paralvinella palmiformis]
MIGRLTGDQMWKEEVLERAQDLLLQCVTPDSVIRLKNTRLSPQLAAAYADRYNNHQKHGSLQELLQQLISERDHTESGIFLQVTTHSKLLSSSEAYTIGGLVGFPKEVIQFASLHAFDTEHQFCKMLKGFFNQKNQSNQNKLLMLQCESGGQSGDLIACARYIIQDEYVQAVRTGSLIHVVLIVQLTRKQGNFIGFQVILCRIYPVVYK